MKNTMTITEFAKELQRVGYSEYNANIECKPTFWHNKKEYKSPLMCAIRMADDWCQGFTLKDGSEWVIAKVKTVPLKFLKSIDETRQWCIEYGQVRNYKDYEIKYLITEMTEAYYTKEKTYQLYVHGCDDASYSQAFSTLKEIKNLIAEWDRNPPDAPWNGAIFTN